MFSIFIFWNIGGDKIISKLFIALIDFKGIFSWFSCKNSMINLILFIFMLSTDAKNNK